MFSETKSPFRSLGVFGGVSGIVIGLAGSLGYALSADDVAQARDLIMSLATTAAGMLALWGRIRAKSRVSLKD